MASRLLSTRDHVLWFVLTELLFSAALEADSRPEHWPAGFLLPPGKIRTGNQTARRRVTSGEHIPPVSNVKPG
jgi:hypothetical protein